MNGTWIVVGNAVDTYVYALKKSNDPFLSPQNGQSYNLSKRGYHCDLIEEMHHEECRMKDCDLISDSQGRYKGRDAAPEKYEAQTTRHQLEQMHFAQDIAGFLATAQTDKRFERLVLCTPPHFYGVLRKELNNQVNDKITLTIQKDLVAQNKHGLDAIVDKVFA